MIIFDKNLTEGDPTPGLYNANLGPIQLRLNPDSVDFSFNMKVARIPTIGGMVVQIYGIDYSDVTVTGSFGAGGWEEQKIFFDNVKALADAQGTQQLGTTMAQPIPFNFPSRDYHWHVFIKDYSSPQGTSIVHDNTLINPQYTLTLFVVMDNTNLKKVATDAFIANLSKNFGWTPNQYNGPSASEVTSYLQAQGGPAAFLANITGAPSTSPATVPTGNQSNAGSGAAQTGQTLTAAQIYADAVSAGFSGQSAIWITAIALAESRGDTAAVSGVQGDGTRGYGLTQIETENLKNIPGWTTGSTVWQNPVANLTAAYIMSSSGTNFNAWCTAVAPMPGVSSTGCNGTGSGNSRNFIAAATAAAGS